MKLRALAAIIAVSVASTAASANKFDKILRDEQTKLHIPGLAYAIVKDDKVVAIGAIGLRDVDKKLAATEDTVFPIGSCTKSFTAMAAAIAADEKKLSLDDSPHRFLPYFKMADPEANELVSLRDMLAHRTGVMPYGDLAAEPDVLTREDYIRTAVGAKPVAKLRAGYQYSNAMVTAVGEVVAKAYATTWEKVIETKIFAPLGMTASATRSDKLASLADGAVGYTWDGAGWKAAPAATSLRVLAPAGAIASSATDMAKWLRVLANGGQLDGKRLVAESLFAELAVPHTQINDTLAYGLGWAIYDWNGHHVMEHNGGSVGLSAIVSVIPERHAGFVILANTSPTELTKIGALGAQLWPLILDERASTRRPTAPHVLPAAPPPPLTMTNLPKPDELVAQLIAATGGEANLRAHAQLKMTATGRYDHQGVDVEITTLASETKRVDDEAWTAAGKRIGRLRVYFDGAHGGQQTTFGQDGDADDPARAARDATLHPLLDLKALYDKIAVEGRTTLDGDDVIVLALTPKTGDPVRLYVSARTHLIAQRTVGAETTRYTDYKNVDGEIVPMAWTVHDALGDKTLHVKEIRFAKAPPPDSAFAKLPALKR